MVDFGAGNTGLCMKGGFSKDSIELWDCCLNHSTEEDGGLSSTYIKANSELSNVAFIFVCVVNLHLELEQMLIIQRKGKEKKRRMLFLLFCQYD